MIETRIACPAEGLRRALLKRCGGIEFVATRMERWASVTFTGGRHELICRIAGADCLASASRFCAGIGEAEFELPGHIVADIAVTSLLADDRDAWITLEALTVEAH